MSIKSTTMRKTPFSKEEDGDFGLRTSQEHRKQLLQIVAIFAFILLGNSFVSIAVLIKTVSLHQRNNELLENLANDLLNKRDEDHRTTFPTSTSTTATSEMTEKTTNAILTSTTSWTTFSTTEKVSTTEIPSTSSPSSSSGLETTTEPISPEPTTNSGNKTTETSTTESTWIQTSETNSNTDHSTVTNSITFPHTEDPTDFTYTSTSSEIGVNVSTSTQVTVTDVHTSVSEEAPPSIPTVTTTTTEMTTQGTTTTTTEKTKQNPYKFLKEIHNIKKDLAAKCYTVCKYPMQLQSNLTIHITMHNTEYFIAYGSPEEPIRDKAAYRALKELYPQRLHEVEMPDGWSDGEADCRYPINENATCKG